MSSIESKAKNLGVGLLLGAGLLGVLGAKVSWPSTAQAGELWTTKAPAAATANASNSDLDVMKLNRAFTTLAENMSPTVVNVYTKTGLTPPGARRGLRRMPHGFAPPDDDFDFFGNPFDGRPMQPPEVQALGSGFVINTDGYIVTNAHVVRMAGHNADEIMIKLIGEDEKKGHPARIIGVDESSDVALLKLNDKIPGLKAAPLGDSDRSKVGEWVVAIGNPYGHTHTFTQGVVSAVGRNLEGARADFIQTSASINPGNSGGPLINLEGEVIGINTAIDARAQGIGFAIPINAAKTVISQLMTSGHVSRGWMGLAIQDLNDDIAGYMRLKNTEGVLVKEVVPGQPAAKAGLAAYDVIRKINGKDVKTSKDLVRAVEKIPVGQSAEVEVLRENQVKDFKVNIGEQPANS